MTSDIRYVGVTDDKIDLFEGQYAVPNGITYNSYAIIDEKIAVFDTTDAAYTKIWLENLKATLGGRRADYLVVQHMEPDHSSGIKEFAEEYPKATIVASRKAFDMMKNFFGKSFEGRRLIVGDGDVLHLGKHSLTFLAAPMVHWPEVIVSYERTKKILFSADAFGKFGYARGKDAWRDEARRYYIGIVSKYGAQVQLLLSKIRRLDIKAIYPLHGPMLSGEVGYYIDLYDVWSSYAPEEKGVTIAFASVYGHTRAVAKRIRDELTRRGIKVALFDLSRCDESSALSSAFRFSSLILASTTYNADVFPAMRSFLHALAERGFKNRTVALVENGSWAPSAAKVMRAALESTCRDLSFAETEVRINGAPDDETEEKIKSLLNEITKKCKQ